MPPNPLSDAERTDIHGYAQRVAELLESCADHQQHDPEVFLWNARRAMEAICLMLIAASRTADTEKRPARDDKAGDNALHAMIEELRNKRVLDKQQSTRFTAIREHTNLGVHIRQAARENYPDAVQDVRALLPKAVRWVIEESPAAAFITHREAMEANARRIEEGGRPRPRALDEADQWRRLYEKAIDDLEAAREELAAARDALRLVREHAPAAPPSAAGRRIPGLPLLALGLLLGLTGVMGASLWEREAPRRPLAQPIRIAEGTVAEAKLTAPERPACPAGMTLVSATTLQLGQPQGGRKNWPPPDPEEIAPIVVSDFCIDWAPRSRNQLAAWPESAALNTDECSWRETGGDDGKKPVACVRHREAASYCADAVPGGRLPTIAEWEALERSSSRNLARGGIAREWAADTFPPAIFNRAGRPCEGAACGGGLFREEYKAAQRSTLKEEGDVLWRWINQEPTHRWKNLGFRCAITPSQTP